MRRARTALLCLVAGIVGALSATALSGQAAPDAQTRTIQLRQGDIAIMPYSRSIRGDWCAPSRISLHCLIRGAEGELSVEIRPKRVTVGEGPKGLNAFITVFDRRVR